MDKYYRKRRVVAVIFSMVLFCFAILTNTPRSEKVQENVASTKSDTSLVSLDSSNVEGEVLASTDSKLAINVLEELTIKGRAPKTGYSRDEFGGGWLTKNGCDTRNIILNRDLSNVKSDEQCHVLSGTLNDPYTGKTINFVRGTDTSSDVQIDHVVALGDAWQKGAQLLTKEKRTELANDPLELLAVDGNSNLDKSDGDAATWLPPNKAFRCQYVARQIAVKQKYQLWVTQSEYDAIRSVLNVCPKQLMP